MLVAWIHLEKLFYLPRYFNQFLLELAQCFPIQSTTKVKGNGKTSQTHVTVYGVRKHVVSEGCTCFADFICFDVNYAIVAMQNGDNQRRKDEAKKSTDEKSGSKDRGNEERHHRRRHDDGEDRERHRRDEDGERKHRSHREKEDDGGKSRRHRDSDVDRKRSQEEQVSNSSIFSQFDGLIQLCIL